MTLVWWVAFFQYVKRKIASTVYCYGFYTIYGLQLLKTNILYLETRLNSNENSNSNLKCSDSDITIGFV